VTHHLLDSSIWLAIAISGHEHHTIARDWFEGMDDADRLYFCRQTQQSFLRLLSTAAFQAQFADPPLTNEEAWAVYDALMDDDRISLQADEPASLTTIWRDYSSRATASPKLWMDAYLAAFATAGGYRFVTADRGFRQYQGLNLLLLGQSSS
jgi:toxin-antitoxin system PIN domain toxin